MKLYAALVFSFCMGLHGNSQTTNKAEVDHAGSRRIADPFCDTATSSRPGISQDQLVKAIIDQTVCRGRFVTPEGINGITFVPISDHDRATVIALGTQALGSLTNIADTGDSFTQLIAVRLIADIGGPDAAPPLERALEPRVWIPTRMAALYGISKQDPKLADPILQRMTRDADPKIREIAAFLLKEAHR
jgi:HEAT repeat protein